MKKKTLFFLSMLLCTAAYAQNDSLKLHFDFTSVEGTTVKDNVTGLAAKTVGSASVKSIGKYKVLDLGNGSGYLDMTQYMPPHERTSVICCASCNS